MKINSCRTCNGQSTKLLSFSNITKQNFFFLKKAALLRDTYNHTPFIQDYTDILSLSKAILFDFVTRDQTSNSNREKMVIQQTVENFDDTDHYKEWRCALFHSLLGSDGGLWHSWPRRLPLPVFNYK